MKRPAILQLFLLIFLSSFGNGNDANINFISSGHYQLMYHHQTISIYFDECRIPSYHDIIKPVEISESERYAIVKTIKEQLSTLPIDFIQKYLDISIYPFHIFREEDYGYYYNKEIVIDIDKIKPNMSFAESITSTLMQQICAITILNYAQEESTIEMKAYLEKFYAEHSYNYGSRHGFESGYVTPESAGINRYMYSTNYELNELFSFLLTPKSRNKLQRFIDLNPNSLLAQKVDVFIDYLAMYSPSFSRDYFFDNTPPPVISELNQATNINAEQFLNMHEIKSNESFDFSLTGYHEELEASARELPAFADMDYHNNEIYESNENNEIETVFGNNKNEKTKKKK